MARSAKSVLKVSPVGSRGRRSPRRPNALVVRSSAPPTQRTGSEAQSGLRQYEPDLGEGEAVLATHRPTGAAQRGPAPIAGHGPRAFLAPALRAADGFGCPYPRRGFGVAAQSTRVSCVPGLNRRCERDGAGHARRGESGEQCGQVGEQGFALFGRRRRAFCRPRHGAIPRSRRRSGWIRGHVPGQQGAGDGGQEGGGGRADSTGVEVMDGSAEYALKPSVSVSRPGLCRCAPPGRERSGEAGQDSHYRLGVR